MRCSPVLISLLSVVSLGAARAQTGPAEPRRGMVLDLTGATGPQLNYASAAVWQLWSLDAGHRFQLGLGIRASHYFANGYSLDNQTTPDHPGIEVKQPRLTSLNGAFCLRARVAGPVWLGFNLDVGGLSFGPQREAMLRNNFGQTVNVLARPLTGNLLLGGSRDRGSLNSEFYAAVALPHGLSLRAGWSHIVTAYAIDNNRYRRFHNLGALGLSYQLP